MPEWDPEIAVEPGLARRLIDAQLPELAGRPLRRLAEGWDNAVYLAGDAWIVRFPRRVVAVPGIEREIALLPSLAPRLSLPIPVPTLIGRPSDDFPWPFFAAPLIRGREVAQAHLGDDRRAALAVPLARFLRALHAPELAAELGSDLPVDPMRRADMTFRVPMTRQRLDEAAGSGVVDLRDQAAGLLAAAAELPPGMSTAIAHGDLHLRHLLIGDDGRLAGVIDWGDVCRADPSIDLIPAFSLLPPSARPAFRAAYGPIDEVAWARAQVLSLFLCVVLAIYGRATGDAALETEAVASARRTLDGTGAA